MSSSKIDKVFMVGLPLAVVLVVIVACVYELISPSNAVSYTLTFVVAVASIVLLFLIYYSQRRARAVIENERADFKIAAMQSNRMLRIYDVKNKRLKNIYHEGGISWRETPEQMVADGIVSSRTADAFLAFYQAILDGEEKGSADAELQDAQGVLRWYHASFTLVRDADGMPDHAVVTVFDNSDEMAHREEYERWNDSVALLVAYSVIYIKANLTQNAIEAEFGNPDYSVGDAATYTMDSLLEHDLQHFVYHEDAARYAEFLRRERLMTLYYSGVDEDNMEVRLYSRNASEQPRWFRLNVSMAAKPASQDIELIAIFTDIDQEKTEQLRLQELASKDSLTGLLNHKALRDQVLAALGTCDASEPVALFMIDLDNFKAVNDTHGHQRGDEVLKGSAAIIAKTFREEDLVGRVGGDEFVAFVRGAAPDVVQERAAALCSAMQCSVGNILLSATVGVSVMQAGDASFEQLFQVGDAALYRAKNNGKSGYQIDYQGDTVEGLPPSETGDVFKAVQLQEILSYMDAGVMLIEVGPEIKSFYVSPSFYRVMKRSKASYSGDFISLIYVDDREEVIGAIRAAGRTGDTLDRTYQSYFPDGTLGWSNMRAGRIPFEGSEYPVLIAVLTDVTALKSQEQTARLSQEIYQTAMAHTNALIWEIDVKDKTVVLSSKLEEAHAHRAAAIQGVSLEGLMATGLYLKEDRYKIDEMLTAILQGEPGHSVVLRERMPDGAVQWARYSYTMIYDSIKAPVRAIGTIEVLPNINAAMEVFDEERRLQQAVVGHILSCICVNIDKGQVEHIEVQGNPAHKDLFSRSRYDEMFQLEEDMLFSAEDRRVCRSKLSCAAMSMAFERGESWILTEFRIKKKQGAIIWVSSIVRLLRDPASGSLYAFCYIQDIDLRKRWELALPQKPERELLGYLYTEETMIAMVDAIVAGNRRKQGQCGMMIFELHGLDTLQERAGVQTASDALMFYSRVLRVFSSSNMIAGRGSKGRFVIFAPQVDSAEAFTDATRWLYAQIMSVRDAVVGDDGIEIIIGVAVGANADADFEILYKNADVAFDASVSNITLYKDQGRASATTELAAIALVDGEDIGTAARSSAGMIEPSGKQEGEELALQMHDSLTGALNRNAYNDMVIHTSPDALSSLGVLLADVDQLSDINRELGMVYGDNLICLLAETLLAHFDSDTVYRVLGGRMLVVAKNLTKEDFTARCKEVSDHLQAARPDLVSFNYSWDEYSMDIDKMIRSVEALLRLERQQRPQGSQGLNASLSLKTRELLKHRIDEDQFEIYLQPKARAKDGTVRSAEALVRLRDPEDGLLAPNRFIPLYEKEGVISLLDLDVLEKSFELLARWHNDGVELMCLSVNFSRLTLLTPGLHDMVAELVQKHRIAPEYIEIEITENTGNVGRSAMTDACEGLRDLGFKLSLDDFGSEYSSLYVLDAIRFDSVKIDKSVIDDLAINELSQLTVQYIVSLCEKTGGACVAEGVETEQQLEILRKLGCDLVQGYIINKPLPVAEFERLYMK